MERPPSICNASCRALHHGTKSSGRHAMRCDLWPGQTHSRRATRRERAPSGAPTLGAGGVTPPRRPPHSPRPVESATTNGSATRRPRRRDPALSSFKDPCVLTLAEALPKASACMPSPHVTKHAECTNRGDALGDRRAQQARLHNMRDELGRCRLRQERSRGPKARRPSRKRVQSRAGRPDALRSNRDRKSAASSHQTRRPGAATGQPSMCVRVSVLCMCVVLCCVSMCCAALCCDVLCSVLLSSAVLFYVCLCLCAGVSRRSNGCPWARDLGR